MNCSDCVNQFKCHNESTKMMGAIKDIIKGQNNGFSQLAYDSAEKLNRILEERHHRIMTGECFK